MVITAVLIIYSFVLHYLVKVNKKCFTVFLLYSTTIGVDYYWCVLWFVLWKGNWAVVIHCL